MAHKPNRLPLLEFLTILALAASAAQGFTPPQSRPQPVVDQRAARLKALHTDRLLSDQEYQAALERLLADTPPTTTPMRGSPGPVASHQTPGTPSNYRYDVAVIPFRNLSNRQVDQKVYEGVVRVFQINHLRVAPLSEVRAAISGAGVRSPGAMEASDFPRVGASLGARFVVTGVVERFSAEKKFSLGGFLVSPLGGGVTAYGTVGLNSTIYGTSEQRIVWEDQFKTTKKNQVFGLFADKDTVSGRAFDAALTNLYRSFFQSR